MEHSAQTFAGQKPRRDSKHVQVVMSGVASLPNEVEDRAGAHGDGIEHLWYDKREPDSVPVRDVYVEAFRNDGVL